MMFISPMGPESAAAWADEAAEKLRAEPTESRVRIIFLSDSTRLPAGSRAILDNFLDRAKAADSGHRLIIVEAYAALPERPAWEAYRLSLDRALTIRNYLLRHTLSTKEIILKPLGNLCDDPCQRVDIFLTKR